MKAILTLIFILLIGLTAQAKEVLPEQKVVTIEMGIVADTKKEVEGQKVARLYRRSNTRVKKALTFTTKKNRAKLA